RGWRALLEGVIAGAIIVAAIYGVSTLSSSETYLGLAVGLAALAPLIAGPIIVFRILRGVRSGRVAIALLFLPVFISVVAMIGQWAMMNEGFGAAIDILL